LFNAIHQRFKKFIPGCSIVPRCWGNIYSGKDRLLVGKSRLPYKDRGAGRRYWQQKGFSLSVRKIEIDTALGWSYFSPEDVDLGFIRGIPVGSSDEVRRLIEKGGIELRDTIPVEVVNRWQHWLV
jgi:hypothetical protein